MKFKNKNHLLVSILTFSIVNIANATDNSVVYNELRPVKQIDSGKIQGVENNEMVFYKNIPYAAAPIGDLRWRPPQPAQKWEGVRDASVYGEACLQPLVEGLNPELAPGVEDCLKLNVFSPKNAKNAPVMVWIHGGGLAEGSAKEPYYYPKALVREGAVVVTFDYRLGKLGYFVTDELIKEAQKNNEPFGNYGTMDQIQALKWVRDNISQFGGNPDNVTIFGQSAGGRSVTWLMSSPLSKGLFQRAIAQSAQQLPMRETSKPSSGMNSELDLQNEYLKDLGVSSLTELRNLPAESLKVTPKEFQDGEFGGAFIDNQVIIGNPLELFSNGKIHNVPFMIGTNSWDASYFALGQPKVSDYLAKLAENPEKINKLYKDFDNKCVLSAEIMADGWYKGATKLLAEFAGRTQPSYAYYFDYVTPTFQQAIPGAGHTFEIPYVFGSMDKVIKAPSKKLVIKDKCVDINKAIIDMRQKAKWSNYWFPQDNANNKIDIDVSERMSKIWVNFAKNGNPNYDNSTKWNTYNLKSDEMILISGDKKKNVIKDLGGLRVKYQIESLSKTH